MVYYYFIVIYFILFYFIFQICCLNCYLGLGLKCLCLLMIDITRSLSIFVSLDDNEVFSKFDEFNENWWFPCSKQATKSLFIVLGFQN